MGSLSEIKRVVVRGANWVGDAVMTIPALRQVRRLFDGAHLSLWTRPPLCQLYQETDLVDACLSEPAHSLLQTVRDLRAGSFDVAILFQNAFRAAWVVWLARIPVRCGYRTDGRGILLTHPIPIDPRLTRQHQVFYYLHLVSQLERSLTGRTGVNFASPDVTLPMSPARRERGLAFLRRWGVDPHRALVVINPGATNSRAKRWLPERFAALSDRLLDRGDTSLVFIGAKEETGLAERIAAQMRHKPIVLTGQTDLKQLVDVLGCARLLISNDTGPAHIGAAVGTPTLVIFGPTEHVATRPFSDDAVVIRHPVSCSPCMLRECPIDHRCMTGIAVERVVSEATEILDAGAPGRLSAAPQ